MRFTKQFVTILCVTLLGIISAAAEEAHVGPITKYIETSVKPWLSEPVIIDAIKIQNEVTKSLTDDEILALDQQWRAETESASQPLIAKLLNKDISKFLIEKQELSDELLLEIFVMDARGLNVGISQPTSDYWQGDEAKWINTFLKGPDAIFIDDVDIDASTLTFQAQASLTVSDPYTGDAIGAITLGFSFEKL